MKEAQPLLLKGDWIRFQVKASKMVLEGFVQEFSPDDTKIKVGKGPASPENTWYAQSDINVLQQQRR